MKKRNLNLYGWTPDHDRYLQTVFKDLRKKGIPVERNGEPNTSAILLYLLEREAKKVSS